MYKYILGGGLISRHLPKTHAITAGTQKNRISRHRQNSRHQQQITMGTAHSAHPLTSPNLNKTRPALCKTKGNSIQLSYHQQQITMGTAHSAHPLTSPNLNKTMRTLCKTKENTIQVSHHQQQITMGTAHSAHPLTSPNLSKIKRTVL